MQFFNGTTYVAYYYVSNAYTDSNKTAQTTGWADANQVLANDIYLNVGDAFWFKADNLTGNASLTVAGAVAEGNSKQIAIGSSAYIMAANPFPTAAAIKDIECSLPASTWRNRSSQAVTIQYFNGTVYVPYYYVSNAYTDSTKTAQTTGWADANQVITTDSIPAGAGFWVKTPGTANGTLTFKLK